MMTLTYGQITMWVLMALWIGGIAGALIVALCHMAGDSACTGDCDQGRHCTCGGSRDA